MSWLPLAAAAIALLVGLAQLAKGRNFGKWIALGSALFLVAGVLFMAVEPQIPHIADSESGRMVVRMLLETAYFGISSIGMILMFLAVVAGRPDKDSRADPEEQFAKLAKSAWNMYKNSRMGKR